MECCDSRERPDRLFLLSALMSPVITSFSFLVCLYSACFGFIYLILCLSLLLFGLWPYVMDLITLVSIYYHVMRIKKLVIIELCRGTRYALLYKVKA